MNSYVCFYRNQHYEVRAETSFKAQQLAAKHFKAKKSWEVTVMLAGLANKPVIHKPDF